VKVPAVQTEVEHGLAIDILKPGVVVDGFVQVGVGVIVVLVEGLTVHVIKVVVSLNALVVGKSILILPPIGISLEVVNTNVYPVF
jgi:hypothetical protein